LWRRKRLGKFAHSYWDAFSETN